MSRNPSDLIESIFSFSSSKKLVQENVIQFLKQFGFSRADIIEVSEKKRKEIRVYSTAIKAAKLRKVYGQNKILSAAFSRRRLAREEWAEKWKEDYKIQNLGQSFVVVPVWREKEYLSGKWGRRIPIRIDPMSAFGSGEHETTRLIVRMMEKMKGKYSSFIDIGTGTGILSIAAAHCGACRIFGFDNDKPSAKCAAYNFKKNLPGVQGDFICAELAQYKVNKRFDLVCANINSHILEKYRSEITRFCRKGGWVLVSGILRQTYASFREAFDGKDLECLKVLRGRRWISVLYKKS